MKKANILNGWTLEKGKDGAIIVQKSGVGGVVVRDGDESSIAASILHSLATDMLAEASRPDPLAEALNSGDGVYRP